MSSLKVGYSALVVGASGGIGAAIAARLWRDERLGELDLLSRSHDGFDVTREESVRDHASRLADRSLNLVVCATGALTINGIRPEKSIRQIDVEAMQSQFLVNAIGPTLILKHFLPLISRNERAIVAFLSARVGSIGDNHLGGWMSYRASKAALNQIVKTAAIELARTHQQCVVIAIHPGTVSTPLSQPFSRGRDMTDPADAATSILRALNETTPEKTGAFIAYDGSVIAW